MRGIGRKNGGGGEGEGLTWFAGFTILQYILQLARFLSLQSKDEVNGIALLRFYHVVWKFSSKSSWGLRFFFSRLMGSMKRVQVVSKHSFQILSNSVESS